MGSIIAVVVVLVTLLTKPVMLVDFVPGLQAVVSGAAVGFMLWVAFSGVRRRPLPVIFPVALGITIAGGVSIFYAIDPILGVRQLVSTFPLRPLFFLSMLLWVDSLTRTRLVMRTIVFCGAAFAAHGLLQAASASFGFLSGAGDFGILGRVTANSTGIMSLVDPDAEGLGFVFPESSRSFRAGVLYGVPERLSVPRPQPGSDRDATHRQYSVFRWRGAHRVSRSPDHVHGWSVQHGGGVGSLRRAGL